MDFGTGAAGAINRAWFDERFRSSEVTEDCPIPIGLAYAAPLASYCNEQETAILGHTSAYNEFGGGISLAQLRAQLSGMSCLPDVGVGETLALFMARVLLRTEAFALFCRMRISRIRD